MLCWVGLGQGPGLAGIRLVRKSGSAQRETQAIMEWGWGSLRQGAHGGSWSGGLGSVGVFGLSSSAVLASKIREL